MEEKLITYKTAKLAKDRGFDVPVLYSFDNDDGTIISSYSKDVFTPLNYNSSGYKHSAPTQSLLQKWLREVHKIHVEVFSWYTGKFYAFKLYKNSDDTNLFNIIWSESNNYHKKYNTSSIYTYEQALERGLQEALKLIKI